MTGFDTCNTLRRGVFPLHHIYTNWARVSDYDNLRFSRGDPSFNTTFLVVPNGNAEN